MSDMWERTLQALEKYAGGKKVTQTQTQLLLDRGLIDHGGTITDTGHKALARAWGMGAA